MDPDLICAKTGLSWSFLCMKAGFLRGLSLFPSIDMIEVHVLWEIVWNYTGENLYVFVVYDTTVMIIYCANVPNHDFMGSCFFVFVEVGFKRILPKNSESFKMCEIFGQWAEGRYISSPSASWNVFHGFLHFFSCSSWQYQHAVSSIFFEWYSCRMHLRLDAAHNGAVRRSLYRVLLRCMRGSWWYSDRTLFQNPFPHLLEVFIRSVTSNSGYLLTKVSLNSGNGGYGLFFGFLSRLW